MGKLPYFIADDSRATVLDKLGWEMSEKWGKIATLGTGVRKSLFIL